jgi:hypothetical protein
MNTVIVIRGLNKAEVSGNMTEDELQQIGNAQLDAFESGITDVKQLEALKDKQVELMRSKTPAKSAAKSKATVKSKVAKAAKVRLD